MKSRFACGLALLFMVGAATAQEEEAPAVEVGTTAPNFTATTDTDEEVELQDYLDDNEHVAVVFVRAHW